MAFTDVKATEILGRLHDKGWNVYERIERIASESDRVIREGLAESLEVGKTYVVLPEAKEPTNPESVHHALETLSRHLNREMPTISVYGVPKPWTGFTFRRHEVKVHTPGGDFMPYDLFNQAIDSVVQVERAEAFS